LQTGGPFTVFAPTDTAFEALGPELQSLLKNTTALCPIIEYHVVKGSVPSTALPAGQSYAPSLAGPIIFIEKGQGVELNCFSRVVSADNGATNGEVHVIDRVILPPTAL
jgi:transforming growth factor-beta-induced protein